ncbi:uncharacterized protein LOC103700228 isoform X3 [Phoenix dactylifera]|uniref:Uncharacterized protein LOC103700228 isoform X3 n=1 Tax=Phoenix dactylifera TaxID=42345 RepID=A0A8B9A897_PHODC|nr:uncharacterized protein LOC103700228 isoform X3 [Phoenix dactylifera]
MKGLFKSKPRTPADVVRKTRDLLIYVDINWNTREAKREDKPEFNGSENLEFPEFYKKMHTKKNKKWIDPICTVKHSKMLSLREESSQSGVQLTSEEMSRQALGKRKRYILGFGDGPKPSSSSSTSSRVS